MNVGGVANLVRVRMRQGAHEKYSRITIFTSRQLADLPVPFPAAKTDLGESASRVAAVRPRVRFCYLLVTRCINRGFLVCLCGLLWPTDLLRVRVSAITFGTAWLGCFAVGITTESRSRLNQDHNQIKIARGKP